jgi:hypothetical protein
MSSFTHDPNSPISDAHKGENSMENLNIPATGVRPTTLDDGLEVEVFTTEDEAQASWNSVPSHVEQQAAAFVAQTAHIASEGE